MKTSLHFLLYFAQFFLEELFQTQIVEIIKICILCCITFFYRKLCRLWDMWKNTVEPDMPQMTIWRMRVAYWVT